MFIPFFKFYFNTVVHFILIVIFFYRYCHMVHPYCLSYSYVNPDQVTSITHNLICPMILDIFFFLSEFYSERVEHSLTLSI